MKQKFSKKVEKQHAQMRDAVQTVELLQEQQDEMKRMMKERDQMDKERYENYQKRRVKSSISCPSGRLSSCICIRFWSIRLCCAQLRRHHACL